MGLACEEVRRHLVIGDVRKAEQVLLGGKERARRAIGFIRPGPRGEGA